MTIANNICLGHKIPSLHIYPRGLRALRRREENYSQAAATLPPFGSDVDIVAE